MNLEESIIKSLDRIIQDGKKLKVGDDEYHQVFSLEQRDECSGWIASALNIIEVITSNSPNPYLERSRKIAEKNKGLSINLQVGEITSLLESLKRDLTDGLLTSIANRARAETFDNFLEHGQLYFTEGKKQESGVIAGVVFEDTLRRICTKYNIPEAGNKLDKLIDDLVKNKIITPIKAKRAKVAAHVRTKATHAQWSEFELDDVRETIVITKDLIENILE